MSASSSSSMKPDKGFARHFPLQILVVDDALQNRLVAIAMLRLLGYQPDSCENGEDALESCRIKAYELLLLDVRMPRVSGFDVAQRLRAAPKDYATVGNKVQIVAITADPTINAKALEHRPLFNLLLDKPVRIESLMRALEQVYSQTPHV